MTAEAPAFRRGEYVTLITGASTLTVTSEVESDVYIVGLIVAIFIATIILTWFLGQVILLIIALPPGAPSKRRGKRSARRSIFISYRRADSGDVAGRIYDRLSEQFGRAAIFRDIDSIPHGLDFRTVLDQTLARCPVVLVLIGPRWADVRDSLGKRRLDDAHDYVRIEVENALEKAPVVIPVLLNHAELPDPADLPRSIQKLVYHNAAEVRPDPDFHNDMNRLIRSIEGALKAVK